MPISTYTNSDIDIERSSHARIIMQYETPQFELGRIVSRKFATPERRLFWGICTTVDSHLRRGKEMILWTLIERHTCRDPGDVDTETVAKKNAIAARRGSSFGSQFKINDSAFLRIVTWFRGPRAGQTLIREVPLPSRPSAAADCSE